MKIIYQILAVLILIALLLLVSYASAQPYTDFHGNSHTLKTECATEYVNEKWDIKPLTDDEILILYKSEIESGLLKLPAIKIIPCVVHVVHQGEPLGVGTNITDNQVYTAINALNNDLKNFSAEGTSPIGVDMEIEFCLADIDPQGNPTTGITRHNGTGWITNYASFGIDAGGPTSKQMADSVRWPVTEYYNFFLVNAINGNFSCNGILGYHSYPSPFVNNYFGDYQLAKAFGVTGNLNFCSTKNKVPPHECGHGFNLRHTFESTTSCFSETNCTSQGDFCCDTYPHPSGSGSTTCAATCNGLENVANYMNYTKDYCQFEFTACQKQRAWTSFYLQPWQSMFSQNPKCNLNAPVVVDFTSSHDTICKDQWIEFANISQNAYQLEWTIQNSLISTSNQNVINTQFTVAGNQQVKLKVNFGADSLIKTVTVIGCQKKEDRYTNDHLQLHLQLQHHTDNNSRIIGISKIKGQEAASSISDSLGDLDIYSNGQKAWDSLGTIVNNNMVGSLNNTTAVSATSSLIIPFQAAQIDNWIFCPPDMGWTNQGVVYYKEGDTTKYNPPKNYAICEGSTAIRHCNGDCFWVIFKGQDHNQVVNQGPMGNAYAKDKIIAYPFCDGVMGEPVFSNSFTVNAPQVPLMMDPVGQMSTNKSGTKLAVSNLQQFKTYIYNFDRTTGAATLDKILSLNFFGQAGTGYGVTFSVTGDTVFTTGNRYLCRWNLSAGTLISAHDGVLQYSYGQLLTTINNTVLVPRQNFQYLSGFVNGIYQEYAVTFNEAPDSIYCRFALPNNIQAFDLPQICFGIPLPVVWLHFSGVWAGDAIQLEWATASEKNNEQFIIEVSHDGINYFPAVAIDGAGNSSTATSYSYSYPWPKDINYFRLWQMDYDGNTVMHPDVVVLRKKPGQGRIVAIYNYMWQKTRYIHTDQLPQGYFIVVTEDGFFPVVK